MAGFVIKSVFDLEFFFINDFFNNDQREVDDNNGGDGFVDVDDDVCSMVMMLLV